MANLWRASFNSIGPGGLVLVNTFHGHTTQDFGSLSDSTVDQVRDALNTSLTAKYRALLPTDFTLGSLIVREVIQPGSTAVPAESAAAINLQGQLAVGTDRTPIPVCLLVTFYTDAAVRSGHGRMFLPGNPNASSLSGTGVWDTTGTWYPTTTTTFLDALTGSISVAQDIGVTNTWHPVVYSRTRHAGGASAYYFSIKSYTKRTQAHWLRSRMTAP